MSFANSPNKNNERPKLNPGPEILGGLKDLGAHVMSLRGRSPSVSATSPTNATATRTSFSAYLAPVIAPLTNITSSNATNSFQHSFEEPVSSLNSNSSSPTLSLFSNNQPSDSPQLRQDAEKERKALYAALRIALNSLVDGYAGTGRAVEDGNDLMERFCTVLEHSFQHGFKGRRRTLIRRREVWDFIQNLEHMSDASGNTHQIFSTIRDMEDLKTGTGRLRAWIRLSLMEQSFARNWRLLVDELPRRLPSLIDDYYEPWSLLRSESILHITGLMSGLDAIEFNLFIKGDDLESRATVIDWSALMQENISVLSASAITDSQKSARSMSQASEFPPHSPSDDCVESAHTVASDPSHKVNELSQLLSNTVQQKNYLEEQNRELHLKITQLTSQFQQVQSDHSNLQGQNKQLQQQLQSSQSLIESLERDKRHLLEQRRQHQSSVETELEIEREYFRESRSVIQSLESQIQSLLVDLENINGDISKKDRRIDAAEAEKNRVAEILKVTQSRLVDVIKAKDLYRRELDSKNETIRTMQKLIQNTGADTSLISPNNPEDHQQQNRKHQSDTL